MKKKKGSFRDWQREGKTEEEEEEDPMNVERIYIMDLFILLSRHLSPSYSLLFDGGGEGCNGCVQMIFIYILQQVTPNIQRLHTVSCNLECVCTV